MSKGVTESGGISTPPPDNKQNIQKKMSRTTSHDFSVGNGNAIKTGNRLKNILKSLQPSRSTTPAEHHIEISRPQIPTKEWKRVTDDINKMTQEVMDEYKSAKKEIAPPPKPQFLKEMANARKDDINKMSQEVIHEYESAKNKIEHPPQRPQFLKEMANAREEEKLTKAEAEKKQAVTEQLHVVDTLTKLEDGTTKTWNHTIDKTTSDSGIIEITIKKLSSLNNESSKAITDSELSKLTEMRDGITSTDKSVLTKTVDSKGNTKILVSPKKEKETDKVEEQKVSDEELLASMTPEEFEKILGELGKEGNQSEPKTPKNN